MDNKIRELERQASVGDSDAQKQLDHALRQAGQLSTFDDVRNRIEELDTLLAKEAIPVIEKMFQKFFQQHGAIINQISWTQYTPYYCDGQQCVFYYHSFLDHQSFCTANEQYPFPESEDRSPTEIAAWEAMEVLDKQLSEVEDILYRVFGDHIEITIDENGLSDSEFKNHD